MNGTIEQRIKPAAIRKIIEVKAPVDRTFRVFTGQIGKWWNKGQSINHGVPQKDVVIEPRTGGRWYEIGEDGSECLWGRVLEWNEPYWVKLAWQIDDQWRYNPDFQTTVEVLFESRGEITVVSFEHRDLDRFGDAMARQVEQMDGGWGMLLERFKTEAETD